MTDYLKQDIKYLAGVGTRRAELFNKELHIYTLEDLLYHFPYKYIDRTCFYTVSQVQPSDAYIQIRGRIDSVKKEGIGNKERLVAIISDHTGTMPVVFFKGVKYLSQKLKTGGDYVIFGKPSEFNGRVNFVHPEMEPADRHEEGIESVLQAQYPTTERLKNTYITSRVIGKLMVSVWQALKTKIPDTFPDTLIERGHLLSLHDALFNAHFPQSPLLLQKALHRLKFEELFWIQLKMLYLRGERKLSVKGFDFKVVGDYFNRFYTDHLPFELTDAQKRVIREIRNDMGSGRQMNRLLQGDVGSGKTLAALMVMLIAMDNRFQACMMVPTEILAVQHYQTITRLLNGMGLNIALLTGSTKKKERETIHSGLADGSVHALIGTHALIEDMVQFANLGLVVIDEQHRFGVAQRAKLWKKNAQAPHILVMTATPIPRTLAMTVYGDLDVSVIDQLPPGRKPVKTVHYYDTARKDVYAFMQKQIAAGRQIYVVYPLISESEKMDYKNLEEGFEHIRQAFPEKDNYTVTVVHGRMPAADKDLAMRLFKEGKVQIMVATTVIEVGVDVPNASVMVIESAERFGLSQLHQLRGRVGRGSDQSFCILMSSYRLSNDARKRIQTMTATSDGFEIAEADLKLRGPGDIEGTQQSGIPFDLKIAHLGKDGQILQLARDAASEILSDDPELTRPENQLLKKMIQDTSGQLINWGEIS